MEYAFVSHGTCGRGVKRNIEGDNMKGYPKNTPIVTFTKQDWSNLLANPTTRGRALADLRRLHDIDDEYVERVVELADPEDPKSEDVAERIRNPGIRAIHRSGFRDHAEVLAKLAEIREKEKVEILMK